MLEKLKKMNFANNSIKTICSYLMDHSQYVQTEDKKLTHYQCFMVSHTAPF